MKGRILSALLVMVATSTCVAQKAVQQKAPSVSADRPAGPGALFYTDKSAGTWIWAQTWHLRGESIGRSVTFVTDADDFAQKLSAGPWSEVAIAAQYAPGQPSYASALRAYADAHPKQRLEMFIWQSDGSKIAADAAVFATTAMVSWWYAADTGYTTISYSDIANNDSDAGKPQSGQGLQFPDFKGIEPDEPTVAFRVKLENEDPDPDKTVLWIPPVIIVTPCKVECATSAAADADTCRTEQEQRLAVCDAAFGPGGEGDPGDIKKWLDCLIEASEAYQACQKTAKHDYNACLAVCDRGP